MDKNGITNILMEAFSTNSSNKNRKQEFWMTKISTENYKLNFKSRNLKRNNEVFSPSELHNAIQNS